MRNKYGMPVRESCKPPVGIKIDDKPSDKEYYYAVVFSTILVMFFAILILAWLFVPQNQATFDAFLREEHNSRLLRLNDDFENWKSNLSIDELVEYRTLWRERSK